MRALKVVTAALLLLNLTLRLTVALRPLEYIDGLTIPDDAYICLTLARNIAEGHGPLFGAATTNGFQPLYVFMMVPVYLVLGHDPVPPVHAALVLLAVFDTFTLYLLFRLVSRTSRSTLTTPLVALAWIINPHVMAMTLNGMETLISCFFLVAVCYYFHTLEERPIRTGWSSFALGSLLAGAMWARIDNALLALVVVIALLGQKNEDLSTRLRRLLFVALGALLTYGPWLLASYYWSGDLYPISGKAVRLMALADVFFQPTFENMYAVMIKTALQVIAIMNRGTLSAIAAIMIALAFLRHRAAPRNRSPVLLLVICWCYALALFGAYTFYEFGHWFFDRYLFPVGIVLLLTFSVLLDELFARLARSSRRTFLAACVAGILVLTNGADPRLHALFFSTDTTQLGYRNLGLWAKNTFPPGTVIGSSQAGALAYFADSLKVINLDGVVNKACYESLLDRTLLEYIHQEKIRYVLGWDANIRYMIYRSASFTPAAFSPPRKVAGFRSWGKEWYLMKVNEGAAR